MEKIASFTVDHTKLQRGVYLSRVDGDIATYDLRFRRPNTEPVMHNAAMHTIEHLFATFARNSALGDRVVYFGPMGCRTGFYFLTRNISHQDALQLMRESLQFIAEYEGEIPGSTAVECGNYLDHDLKGAKEEAAAMAARLQNWDESKLQY